MKTLLIRLGDKSVGQRLNLSGSQHKGCSQRLQYPGHHVSRLQRIYLSRYLEIVVSYDLGRVRGHRLSVCVNIGKGEYRRIPSMDSGLEAFSHNPTDGSFAALPFQATAFTNYLNQRFLSY